uniref:LIM/homeobox protein Awh n=1 Tax=Ditylenchus dipsaci TaxID=166011 RepID=A0A915CPP8_9BILA
MTSSKADRLTSNTASKSRSRCAGDKKISPLVVPAVVKSAEEFASQPSVVSSPAVSNGCLNQPSVFMPASAEPVVDKCSILKPADAEIPDGLNGVSSPPGADLWFKSNQNFAFSTTSSSSLLISEQYADSNGSFEWNGGPKLDQLKLETNSNVGETGRLVSQLFAGEALLNGVSENRSTAALLSYDGEVEKQEAGYSQNGCDKFSAEFELGNYHVSSIPSTSTEYINGAVFPDISTYNNNNNDNHFYPTYNSQFDPSTLINCLSKDENCNSKANDIRPTQNDTSRMPLSKKYARKKLKNSTRLDPKLLLKAQQQRRNLPATPNDSARSRTASNPLETLADDPVYCKSECDKEDTCKRQLIDGQQIKMCFLCQKSINDQFILSVNSSTYHAGCLKCCVCEQEMEEAPTCFLKNDSLYCKTCYLQKFQTKCISCNRQIQATDWVRRARSALYHLACFSCDHCKRQLSTGEQFSIQENRLLCKQHYMELIQGDDTHTKQKTKRVRTTFAEEQIGKCLQAHFQIDCNPDGSDLERIANLTGLSKRVTQVWFQNSRARQKKYQGTKKNGRSASGISGGSGGTADSFSASMNSGHSSPASNIDSNLEGNTEDGMIFPTSVTTSTDDITSEYHHNLSNLENMIDSDHYIDN